jgi:hypothetical protein
MTSLQFSAPVQLQFSSVTPLDSAITAQSNRYFSFPDALHSFSLTLDYQSLNPEDKRLFDDGDLIPGLAYYWLNLCSKILKLNLQRGRVSVLAIPHQNFITDLRVDEVCAQIYRNEWTTSSAETFIAWGVTPELLHKKRPHFPVQCLGAIFPVFDGLGIGWRVSPEEFAELNGIT